MSKNIKKDNIAISACLLGVPCRYDGRCKLNQEAIKIFISGNAIAICPEILGGLAVPRPACEIIGGNGEDVLNGKVNVVDIDGNDYTNEFVKGAITAVDMIKNLKIRKVYLKSKSPSCGVTKIFDGSFTDKTIKGCGVFAALLEKENIELEEL